MEVPADKVGELSITYTLIGEVTDDGKFSYGNTVITEKEAEEAWKGTLERVFKTASGEDNEKQQLQDHDDPARKRKQLFQPGYRCGVFRTDP